MWKRWDCISLVYRIDDKSVKKSYPQLSSQEKQDAEETATNKKGFILGSPDLLAAWLWGWMTSDRTQVAYLNYRSTTSSHRSYSLVPISTKL